MAETYYALTDIVKLIDNLVAAMPTSFYNGLMAVRHHLPEIHAADVVEAVRCEECEYRKDARVNKNGFLICPASGMEITDNDYCSYGERMNNEGERRSDD